MCKRSFLEGYRVQEKESDWRQDLRRLDKLADFAMRKMAVRAARVNAKSSDESQDSKLFPVRAQSRFAMAPIEDPILEPNNSPSGILRRFFKRLR